MVTRLLMKQSTVIFKANRKTESNDTCPIVHVTTNNFEIAGGWSIGSRLVFCLREGCTLSRPDLADLGATVKG